MATYVITRPAREVLFTVVSREEKYKAKVGMPVASDSFWSIMRSRYTALLQFFLTSANSDSIFRHIYKATEPEIEADSAKDAYNLEP
jgi:hypothetical protein